MAYALYVNHPETWDRREANFATWRLWSRKNAPWIGVGIEEMARIIVAICGRVNDQALCETLDHGGDLTAEAAQRALELAEGVMEPETRDVFAKAASSGYGARIVFSQALGSAVTASAYAAKFGSDSEH